MSLWIALLFVVKFLCLSLSSIAVVDNKQITVTEQTEKSD